MELPANLEQWLRPETLGATLKLVLLFGAVSLAPAVLLMTTSFVRIVVVLGILRHGLGIQQLPSTQVMTSLALFMSLVIMAPVWKDAYDRVTSTEALADSAGAGTEAERGESQSLEDWHTAWQRAAEPIKHFMARQIDRANNGSDVWLFYKYLPEERRQARPATYEEVPLEVLLPAFVISELKTAFLIGFQICLPFLVLDLLIASITASIGLTSVSTATISLPLKLLLFVLVDGWHLVVEMLLDSFAPYAG